LGIKVKEVHEEEWSYIPVGGPLPLNTQSVTAFGAAASLVHPATGFSLARSFREAPKIADELQAVLNEGLEVKDASKRVWEKLWPLEKRAQAAFQVFGMELLAGLDLSATNSFFSTFFRLPKFYWRGFLASKLTSTDLMAFAFVTFLIAGLDIKVKLVQHLFTDPAGQYLIRAYMKLWNDGRDKADKQ
jgi:lycopene epsilon-cyclase